MQSWVEWGISHGMVSLFLEMPGDGRSGDFGYVFDTTRLAPFNGLVRIETGRDAAWRVPNHFRLANGAALIHVGIFRRGGRFAISRESLI